MPLCDASDVRQIMELPSSVSDSVLDSFIADADILVQEELVGKGLSDARLTAIEKYLAAHFVLQLTERGGLVSSEVEDAKDQYLDLRSRSQNNVERGLAYSRYGQQALLLDTTQTLSNMSSPKLTARFTVIKSPPRDCV